MTTTEKRLGDIADRLDVIAKAIGRIAKESTRDSDSRVKEARAIVVERESPFKGYTINLYVCAKCNRPIRPGDLYCGKCGGKLVFTDQNEDTKQKETEAEHVTD